MPRAERLRIALVSGAAYWALSLAVQIDIFFGYLMPAGAWTWRSARYLASFPFLQSQSLIVAAILGVAAWLIAVNRRGRWIALPLYVLLAAASLIDQIYYKLFLDHVHLSLFEGGHGFTPSLMLDSFVREWDAAYWISATVAFAGTIWIAMSLARPTPIARPPKLALAVAALIFLAGLPSIGSTRYVHLNENPEWSFLRDWGTSSIASVLAGRKSPAPAPEAAPGQLDRDSRLVQFSAAARAAGKRNVIFVILESVGSTGLLGTNGLPNPLITPNLASLARAGALFDQLYTPFPASIRSLISIHTGGRYLTTGGAKDLMARYTGPTVAGAFNSLGYATALYSSQRLDGEFSDVFLGQVGFGKLYDFAKDFSARDRGYYIHSWGAREDYTVGLMEQWVGDQAAARRPFYLEYYTAATHHPYGAPPGFPTVQPPGEPLADYRNALHYTDWAIGALVRFLADRDLLRTTAIAITGDHGEAFGDRHPANHLHRDYVYEENVREFLLLFQAGVLAQPILSHRIGRNGDIMPTLLDFVDGSAAVSANPVAGQSLLMDAFPQPPVFFHTRTIPEKWGLRDGRWKYIGAMRSSDSPQLFDLDADPREQHNLAAQFPGKVTQYRALCEDWIVRQNEEYEKRLDYSVGRK